MQFGELMQLFQLINAAPCHEGKHASYGSDIDETNRQLFSTSDKTKKKEILFSWAKRFQPCILGRLGASGKRGIQISVVVIDEQDIAKGDESLKQYLRQCRREWKDKCARGESDAILYFMNVEKLSRIPPSADLLGIFTRFSDLIFHEFDSIQPDVIYTEAAPLKVEEKIYLFKAGINFFHTTAHLTSNHDRRIPGGAVISINAVGHYANNMVNRGVFKNVDEAINDIRRFAWQSIGNGGISASSAATTSWHNIDPKNTCPFGQRPSKLPENFSIENYTARYHTDILIPRRLTEVPTTLGDPTIEDRKWLTIEYFTARQYELGSIDFGMFHGYPVDSEAIYFNPFPPIRAVNSPDLIY
ncbi:hypothetical protein [Paraburkholderia caballeronis]|uniref:hypothetical protein n=1 Tax=Paraburkholderia caballeronis TaxID=416943 RepID=UPI0010653C2F|nr:hypothetical protein [Paraburkholderia caballeronis]TDV19447.1 hypothetical protein C7408_102192 [Paraburkholderia caballeronis]TDV22047.1 hypothetical protein C7406_101192 [Paraburkholderia caballeronis]TDV28951.1 hypothetical protein C7404_102193 [Paraburkholderia caballeronis]